MLCMCVSQRTALACERFRSVHCRTKLVRTLPCVLACGVLIWLSLKNRLLVAVSACSPVSSVSFPACSLSVRWTAARVRPSFPAGPVCCVLCVLCAFMHIHAHTCMCLRKGVYAAGPHPSTGAAGTIARLVGLVASVKDTHTGGPPVTWRLCVYLCMCMFPHVHVSM